MALIGSQYVGDATAAVVEKVLRTSTWLKAGETCNDEYTVSGAGKISIPVATGVATEAGITHEVTSSAETYGEVPLLLNNIFAKGKKVYGYSVETVPFDTLAEAEISLAEENREGRQQAALAVLVAQGTALADTTAVTASNVKAQIIAARKALRKTKAKANVLLCSVDVYSDLLTVAGTEFTPIVNEATAETGRVGMYYGALVFEVEDLDGETTYKYVNDSNVVTSVDCSLVEFIMYDSSKLACIDAIAEIQKAPGATFVGTNIIEEISSGIKVTRATAVVVKKKLA